MQYLEHGHDGEAHAKAEDAAAVGHEPIAIVAQDDHGGLSKEPKGDIRAANYVP